MKKDEDILKKKVGEGIETHFILGGKYLSWDMRRR